MLTIASGVILGVIGLWVILSIAAAILEEIALGCIFIVGFLAIIGVFAWLDSEWPEIDWLKTTFAVMGLLFGGIILFVQIIDQPIVQKSPLFIKMRSKFEPETIYREIPTIFDAYNYLLNSCEIEKVEKIQLFKETQSIVYRSEANYTVLKKDGVRFVIRNFDGSILEFSDLTEARDWLAFIIRNH